MALEKLFITVKYKLSVVFQRNKLYVRTKL